ncbi:MAG: restriction endonuclease subunit S [Egibacteraceae bacterium]
MKDIGHPNEQMLSVYRDHGVVQKEGRGDNFNKTAANRNIYQLVDSGWLAVNRMKAWQGSLGISKYRGIVSGHYICFRPQHGEDSRFLDYLLRSPVYTAELRRLSRGVRPNQIEIDNDGLRVLKVRLPSLNEQRTIAEFLDTETARIDALIAKRRRMANVLAERWATVGANSTGLGFAVSATPRVQLRRIARLQAGAAFPHSMQGDSAGTIPYVKVGDLVAVDADGYINRVANRVSPKVAAGLHSPVLPAGTIVLPKIGAALLTNRRAILSEPSCLDQNVMGVTVEVGSPRYVYYCLNSVDLGALTSPGPVPLLNEDVARSVRIPWPDFDEQVRIATELDAIRRRELRAREAMRLQWTLLVERRQALITAAVTGELEVPGVAA